MTTGIACRAASAATVGDLLGADQELQVPAERADQAGEIGNRVEAEPGLVAGG